MLVYHPDALRHILAPGHVESPQRLEAIVLKLEALGLMEEYTVPEPATEEDVGAVHTPSYVELVKGFGEGYLDTDTPIHADTPSFAFLAAGGAVAAALSCLESRGPTFALVRPPGHHAGADYGGGFCILNNVAIAAAALLPRVSRLAILDLDAHHGNGTSDIFAANRNVLYVSTHQIGIYPGTGPAEYVGEGPGEGYTVNIPFPARTGDESFHLAFREIIEPIVSQFHPGAILVSLGVDAHDRDPLTQLGLSSEGYLALVEGTLALAKSAAEGRVAFVLEGGYHLPALAEVIAATCARFRGESIHLQFKQGRDTPAKGREVVKRVRSVQQKYWDL